MDREAYDRLYLRPQGLTLTGAGTVLGIIDQPLWREHPAYAKKIIDYKDTSGAPHGSMHGAAVTSISVGDEIGVAPDASVVYRAIRTWQSREDLLKNHHEALKDLLAYAESGQRLDAITSSHGWKTGEDFAEENNRLIAALEKQGIPVFHCNERVGLAGPNGHAQMIPQEYHEANASCAPAILIDHRLLACFNPAVVQEKGGELYYRGEQGGASWSAPYRAGLFLLAREACPAMTRATFEETLRATAREANLNGVHIKLPDMQAFCETLEPKPEPAAALTRTRPFLTPRR